MAKGKYKPSPTKKKLGALEVGWANKSGTFRASSYKSYFTDVVTGERIGQGEAYATFRIGNTYLKVTKRVGEYMVEEYAQRIKNAKTKEEVAEINTFFKQYSKEKPGQVGILLENISKNAGISQMFKARLSGKMSSQTAAKFDDLAKMIEEINKDRVNAQLFYTDTKRQFQIVADKYREMKEQGGVLDEFQMQELESALDILHQMAEQYSGRTKLHQMEVTRVRETSVHTYSTPSIEPNEKRAAKKKKND